MTTWEWIVVVVAVAVALLLVLALVRIRRRRAYLKEQFGPEYTRAVSDVGTGDANDVSARSSRRARSSNRDRSRPRHASATSTNFGRRSPASSTIATRRGTRRDSSSARSKSGDIRARRTASDSSRSSHSIIRTLRTGIGGHAMLENVDGEQATENLRRAMLDFRSVLEDVVQGAPTAA